MKLIYLASPYSHHDPIVREDRYRAACKATLNLLHKGVNVFSPIVHSHPLALLGMLGDWEQWRNIDTDWIERCDEVYVLCIDGWKASVGVKEEIEIAHRLGKRVRYVDMKGDDVPCTG